MTNFLEELIGKTPRGKQELARASLRVAVTQALLAEMERLGMNKSELAKKIGVSRSAITQALSATNMSLNRVADIAGALGMRVDFVLQPTEVKSRQIFSNRIVNSWVVVNAKPRAINRVTASAPANVPRAFSRGRQNDKLSAWFGDVVFQQEMAPLDRVEVEETSASFRGFPDVTGPLTVPSTRRSVARSPRISARKASV